MLTPDECTAAVSKVWDFLEKLGSGIDRRDIGTWGDERWPGGPGSTFLASYGAEHCEAAWFVRGRPKVKSVFAALWGTDELLVNFDAINAHRPWWHPAGDLGWRKATCWQ